jgi:hypothetical protein
VLRILRSDTSLVWSTEIRGAGTLRIPRFPLLYGVFRVQLLGQDSAGRQTLFDERSFEAGRQTRELGFVRFPHEWCTPSAPQQEVSAS